MARALIVGCGCRGRELGRELLAAGWAVRGTTRGQPRLADMEAAGIEAVVADPDRPGTILDRAGDVGMVVWLLGSAVGEPELIAAIHGPRLERLIEKLVDSPVRGFAYQSAGGVPQKYLDEGRGIVERSSRTWRIPVAILDQEPSAPGWAKRSAARIDALLG